jgi:hypothetical protein
MLSDILYLYIDMGYSAANSPPGRMKYVSTVRITTVTILLIVPTMLHPPGDPGPAQAGGSCQRRLTDLLM